MEGTNSWIIRNVSSRILTSLDESWLVCSVRMEAGILKKLFLVSCCILDESWKALIYVGWFLRVFVNVVRLLKGWKYEPLMVSILEALEDWIFEDLIVLNVRMVSRRVWLKCSGKEDWRRVGSCTLPLESWDFRAVWGWILELLLFGWRMKHENAN